MEIQKTEIYEAGDWILKRNPDGEWKIVSKTGIVHMPDGGIILSKHQFEELAEIIRSIA
jgi:hypothetical protein